MSWHAGHGTTATTILPCALSTLEIFLQLPRLAWHGITQTLVEGEGTDDLIMGMQGYRNPRFAFTSGSEMSCPLPHPFALCQTPPDRFSGDPTGLNLLEHTGICSKVLFLL